MRLPLSNTLGNRDTSTSRDARIVNGYAEGDPQSGPVRAVKRPAVVGAYTTGVGGSVLGQGLFIVSTPTVPGITQGTEGTVAPMLVMIRGDSLYNTAGTSSITKRRTSVAFTVQPTNAGPGIVISPHPAVTVYDVFGNILTTYTGNVTIRIGANPDGGVLSGTLTVAASSGVATFTDLSINRLGTGYTFIASAV